MELEVELPDAPGQLSRVLQVIADHGGNVLSVVHLHERESEGRVPVEIVVEVPEPDALHLVDAITRTHRLLSVNREGGPVRTSVLMVGHVFEADLRTLLDQAFEAGADVSTVDARIQGREAPSAVLVRLTADGQGPLDAALTALRSQAKEHKLQVIEQVGGEADA